MTAPAVSSKRRPRRAALTALLICLAAPVFGESTATERWTVYYAKTAPIAAFDPYSLVVLDSDEHPPLAPLSARGKTLLGYLNLGEASEYRWYFEEVKAEGILREENPDWPGSFFVDLRERRWTARVLSELVPAVLREGFDGLFLDTVDNAIYMEEREPERYAGMRRAALALIAAIRLHYPRIPIMLNRGLEVLPEAAPHIDMVLAESTFADYDFEHKRYGKVPTALYREQLAFIEAGRKVRPALKVYSLDYWDPEDNATIAEIYRVQRANGFFPYVATVELDRIVREPLP